MHRRRHVVGVAAWLSLFMLQLGGLHTHAYKDGAVGAPETEFAHVHSPLHEHGHEHGATNHVDECDCASDISFFELASGEFKLSLAIPASVIQVSIGLQIRNRGSPHFAYRILSGRYTRWRPPLRAPPALA